MTDMTFHIDKDVPIPERKAPNNTKYPWAEMSVGDSFFVPKPSQASKNWPNSLRVSAARTAKKNKWKFAVRKDGTGVRIWRVK